MMDDNFIKALPATRILRRGYNHAATKKEKFLDCDISSVPGSKWAILVHTVKYIIIFQPRLDTETLGMHNLEFVFARVSHPYHRIGK